MSVLSGPGRLLHLLVLTSSFSEDLLCGFPGKQSEADQPVEPWLVIALFEDRYNIHLSPQPFKNNKDDKKWLCSLCILAPYVWVKIS